MFPGAGNHLDDSSKATWQQVEGVTAGGKVGDWDVTTEPQRGATLPWQTEKLIPIVWWGEGGGKTTRGPGTHHLGKREFKMIS